MKKDIEPGMAFNIKKLNKIFAFLSFIFLVSVIWVFLDDYIRPWKAFQIEAMNIKREKISEKLKLAEEKLDKKKKEEVLAEIEKGKALAKSRVQDIRKVEKRIMELKKEIKAETIINGTLNSQVAALTFDYGVAHTNHAPNAKSLFKTMSHKKRLFAESRDRMKDLDGRFKKAQKRLEELKKEQIVAEKELKALTGSIDLLRQAKAQTDMNGIFVIRNAPLIDFLDPTLKIQQLVLTDVTDDRYFQHVPKVDRCITCHTFIDQKGYEKEKNPFKTHPNLDLMVGLKSHHPMKRFGCTSCHGGEGHRVTDFSSPAHTPQNEEQKKEWVEKYNYHPPHKIAQPMYKKGQTEAACIKCHQGVEFIPQGTVVNEGQRNIEKFGCYACHKIEGWEHKRKPGPGLKKIASKVSKEFFKNWVWDPKKFNKHAKMPSFFGLDNNKDPKFMKKNIAEVNAIAEYLFDKSADYKPFKTFSGGNAERGKNLVKEIGCMGCHGVEGFEDISDKIDAFAGPHLTGTGSKVNPDWLVSWLKKPTHYQEDTIMPSFRLTDREANDITAYLMSLKNRQFESLEFEKLDTKVRDEILITYFSAFDTLAVAKKKLDSMSDRERTLELGHRSVGKYGCYSCHNIDGFEGRAPIGPELTKVGSKPLTQFGFGHEHDVEHSRDGWIKAHLLNPRRWDNGIDKPFKDLLRMPDFDMTEEEANSITIALIGQVADKIPLSGIKRLDAHEQIAADGMKVVNKFNCIGCHQVDGVRGDILKMYDEDINEGPPLLVGQGHRVQADWFHHFLKDVYPIRPWLKVRMPTFNLSNEERNAIVSMFQAKEKQQTFVDNKVRVQWEPGERVAAKKLFDSLACASCHTAGFNNEEATAPNLYFAKRRLRPSWIKKWLANPQAILSETVMPNFWEDGEATEPSILDGDPKKQINALTKYLIEIGHDFLPDSQTKYWETK